MRDEFSTFDISKALKIPQPRVREWVDKGFFHPTQKARGQGTKAVFTRDDVYGVALFRLLIDSGFSRAVAGDYVSNFITYESDQPDRQKTAYILFRESVFNGEKKIVVRTFAPGDFKIDVITGLPDIEKYLRDSKVDENWKIVQIVNYKKLCREVDAALETI